MTDAQAAQPAVDEKAAVAWSFAYHCALMASYYILRPIRDQMGIEGGPEKLPALFMCSLVVMLGVNPVYSWLVSRVPRARLIPLVYHFFAFNIFLLWAALTFVPPEYTVWAGYAFFLWVSVFNLFTVAVFWSFMSDVFTTAQGKRVFGIIAAGASVGQLIGSIIIARWATKLGAANLLLVSMLLLELANVSVRRLIDLFGLSEKADAAELPESRPAGAKGGSQALAGIRLALASPYLLGICAYMLLYTFTSSFLYFQKGFIASAAIPVKDARAEFFGQVNIVVGIATWVVSMFATRTLIARLGMAGALTLVPIVTIAGFGALAASPTLWIYAGFEALRSTVNYAVARPAREILYTVVTREEKYKAKTFIDTFVYRFGDGLASLTSTLLGWLAFSNASIALSAIPVAVLWLFNAAALGRAAARKAASASPRPADG